MVSLMGYSPECNYSNTQRQNCLALAVVNVAADDTARDASGV